MCPNMMFILFSRNLAWTPQLNIYWLTPTLTFIHLSESSIYHKCKLNSYLNLLQKYASIDVFWTPTVKVFWFVVFPQDQTDSDSPVSRSVLLISERNARHVVGVLRYLERTDAPLSPVLFSFAEGVHVAREDQKTDRPFCSHLKRFGFCRYGLVHLVQISHTFTSHKVKLML